MQRTVAAPPPPFPPFSIFFPFFSHFLPLSSISSAQYVILFSYPAFSLRVQSCQIETFTLEIQGRDEETRQGTPALCFEIASSKPIREPGPSSARIHLAFRGQTRTALNRSPHFDLDHHHPSYRVCISSYNCARLSNT